MKNNIKLMRVDKRDKEKMDEYFYACIDAGLNGGLW